MKFGSTTPKRVRKNETIRQPRRRKRPRKRSQRKGFTFLWMVVLLCVCVAGGWIYLKVEPVVAAWATLHHYSVMGTDRVQREEVLALLDLPPHVSLFAVKPDSLAQRVETHPWVAAASIERVFPDTLAITVTERKPVAILQSPEGPHLLDKQGHLLSSVSKGQFPSLPKVKGLTPKAFQEERGQAQAQAQKGIQVATILFNELHAVPTVKVEHESTVVADVPGLRFQFGSSFEDQWQRFRALYPSIKGQMNATPKEVDLRYPGKVILRERK